MAYQDFLIDKRILERNIQKGLVDSEKYGKLVENLPDRAENVTSTSLDAAIERARVGRELPHPVLNDSSFRRSSFEDPRLAARPAVADDDDEDEDDDMLQASGDSEIDTLDEDDDGDESTDDSEGDDE